MSQSVPQSTSVLASAPDAAQSREGEISIKFERLLPFLEERGFSAVLLSRNENQAWITAGQFEARVALGSESAVASFLITKGGRKYCITSENEAPRLTHEELAGLGYELVTYPWWGSPAGIIGELAGDRLGADTPQPGAELINLTGLRAPLLETEIARFRQLGVETAEATVAVLEDLEPGVTEHEMAAQISFELLVRGITPTVLLMGADERIYNYKHAVPRSGVLERYGMLNLCARRSGLVISITRFVHFGEPPAELLRNFEHVAKINAALLHATKDGATSSALYAAAAEAFAAAGAPDDIRLHHQGGPCGYGERDWIITPEGAQRVTLPQAYAYNPSLRGAKVEDTAIVTPSGVEVITATPTLPVIETVLDGVVYPASNVLVK
ncbi:M24 family metallopeptidase [Silvibacterium sp.]|uniref:M24 family metallopeptidase n=1 Tax=Silvibacterium sp. TaxID=1964179 RepID=UPI0039E23C53